MPGPATADAKLGNMACPTSCGRDEPSTWAATPFRSDVLSLADNAVVAGARSRAS